MGDGYKQIKLGVAPTRRSIFSAPDAVKYANLTRAKLDELAKYLYEKETITGEEFMAILNRA